MFQKEIFKINKFCKHHINGIGNDNRPENLIWVNPKENPKHIKGIHYVKKH